MITQKNLKELIKYNPKTGIFTWLKRTPNMFNDGIQTKECNCKKWNTNFSEKQAGTLYNNGYILIGIKGKRYLSHRLAYIYMTGLEPKNKIDHVDGNRSNNRWKNLRDATSSQNQTNSKKPKNNTSGFKGVSYKKDHKKWRAMIWHNNNQIHLGYFSTPKKAHNAYCIAAKKYHGDYARIA